MKLELTTFIEELTTLGLLIVGLIIFIVIIKINKRKQKKRTLGQQLALNQATRTAIPNIGAINQQFGTTY
jgi:large-conductance mechanosensitive channel